MGDFVSWSGDGEFGLRISSAKLSAVIQACRRAEGSETGGILIGHYTPLFDCAIITEITGPTEDSKSGRNWFFRGIKGLQPLLVSLWSNSHEYYMGEWHFHPGGKASPSAADTKQMKEIATSEGYQCPEPILLILAGDRELDVKAYVYPKGTEAIQVEPPIRGGFRATNKDT